MDDVCPRACASYCDASHFASLTTGASQPLAAAYILVQVPAAQTNGGGHSWLPLHFSEHVPEDMLHRPFFPHSSGPVHGLAISALLMAGQEDVLGGRQ